MNAWRPIEDTRAEPEWDDREEVTATPCKRSFWDRAARFAYRMTWRDPLIELARCRAINPRSHSYASARRIAMRPVPLTRVRTTAEFIEQDVQPILDRYVRNAA